MEDVRVMELTLRRWRKVIVAAGDDRVAPAQLATLLAHLRQLGYVPDPTLLERIRTLSERDLATLHGGLVGPLSTIRGAHVRWDPMYPGFPAQVMEAPDAELFLNAIAHYLGDLFGVRILPDYATPDRPPLADTLELEPIGLMSTDELKGLLPKLVGAKTSTSPVDKADVALLVERFAGELQALLPTDIPHKENLAHFAGLVLDRSDTADVLLTRYFKTATDVLRLAVARSGGDVSLARPTRFEGVPRRERRLYLALLDRLRSPLEDMHRHRGAWLRLGERLHPGEHRRAFPKAAAAFDELRRTRSFKTFNSYVETALERRDVDAALAELRGRPGDLSRRLDHLLRLSLDGPERAERVLTAFAAAATDVATPVLLQIIAHFRARPTPDRYRAFFPKGAVAKVATVPNTLPPLPQALCDVVIAHARAALVARFSELPPLGRVHVDPALSDYLVPFSQRSASKALRTLVRGSWLPLPEGDTVRFFLWWKEGTVAGKATGRVDIDLSAVMYDADWRYKEHVSYTNLRSAKYKAAHSGDITSAPNGACEFIDLDLASVARHGGRWVVMSVLSFTRQPFDAIPECFAGWMARQAPGSGEIFEPATVVDRLDLSGAQRISVPLVIDVVERRLCWADLALRAVPGPQLNIESNRRGLVHVARAITTLEKPDLALLFGLHAEARGEPVERREDADTVFAVDAGTTPFDVAEIIAGYL